jgi:uncharacterized protein YndB with AHSA1/START domain
MAAKNKSNEIRITRTYDAPLKTVWDAWTDPKQVAQWWGPRGFTLTHHSKDLRAGGHWKYTMHGPDGTDWPNITQYLEVEPLAKLVYDHGGNENQPPLFRVTVLFSEVGGKTKMDMTMGLATVEAAEETRRFIKKAGGDSTWDRLAEYLEKDATGKEKFVIARAFDVSVEKMFELWTNPEHFQRWLPPVGSQMKFKHADIRSGGNASYRMTGVHGTMYGRVEYLQIQKPERLVYTQQFCDEQGNLARHPLAPTWPETMLTTVTFTAEGPERTRVRVEWEPQGALKPEELQTFIAGRAGMTQGWTGSFDKLDELIE